MINLGVPFRKIVLANKMRVAMRSRSTVTEASRKKQDELLSILNERTSSNEVLTNSTLSPLVSDKNFQQEERLLKEQNTLLLEAKRMTKSLYRTCLRSVSILAQANSHDEEIFLERERERLKKENGYEPPVDRENELSSRATYYHSFVQESFQQEVDCLSVMSPESSHLGSLFWREEQVNRFVYLMEQGEERRRWILESYKFDDSYKEQKNEQNEDLQDNLNKWKHRANNMVKDAYKIKGWLTQADFQDGVVMDDDESYENDGDSIDDWR
jgi:hypothetical protein